MSLHWHDASARAQFEEHGLRDLKTLCDYQGGEIITTARTRTLRRIELGDTRYYLKTQRITPRRLPLRKWPSYLGKGSPLVREARALDTLGALDVRVPELVAAGEERRGLLPHRAVLITRELPGYIDLERFLASCQELDARRRACQLAEQLVSSLHERGYVLLGAKYRNILVPEEGAQELGELALLDQPAFRHSRSRRLRRKDLALMRKDRRRYGDPA
jgi:hypothetical protein